MGIPPVRTDTRRMDIRSPRDWLRLVSGMAVVFALFQGSAIALGSDRGQAGIVIGALVTAATLAVERWWFAATLASATSAVGLGRPSRRGLIVAGGISALLVLCASVGPGFSRASSAHFLLSGALQRPDRLTQRSVRRLQNFCGRRRSFFHVPKHFSRVAVYRSASLHKRGAVTGVLRVALACQVV